MSIYLDYASLTPIDPRVARVMKKYSADSYMNPSSIHSRGLLARRAVEEARRAVAVAVGAHEDEIVFTGSGTEANNIAILGVGAGASVGASGGPVSGHIMMSCVEHASVLEPVRHLEKAGLSVTYVPVDESGVVDVQFLKKNLRKDTALVSIMMVNNEIGTIEPIKEIVKIVRDHRKTTGATTLVHTDACQAPLYLGLSMDKLGVDMMTIDGHKLCGPRGIGMLYVRRDIRRGEGIKPIIFGGGQEHGLRSGTENVPAIVGLAEAITIARDELAEAVDKTKRQKKIFFDILKEGINDIKINGADIAGDIAIPHILNVYIPGVDSEFLVLELDVNGVSASTKSSCLRDEDESYVIRSIGGRSASSVRFSFGRFLSDRDVRRAARTVVKVVGEHRKKRAKI